MELGRHARNLEAARKAAFTRRRGRNSRAWNVVLINFGTCRPADLAAELEIPRVIEISLDGGSSIPRLRRDYRACRSEYLERRANGRQGWPPAEKSRVKGSRPPRHDDK